MAAQYFEAKGSRQQRMAVGRLSMAAAEASLGLSQRARSEHHVPHCHARQISQNV